MANGTYTAHEWRAAEPITASDMNQLSSAVSRIDETLSGELLQVDTLKQDLGYTDEEFSNDMTIKKRISDLNEIKTDKNTTAGLILDIDTVNKDIASLESKLNVLRNNIGYQEEDFINNQSIKTFIDTINQIKADTNDIAELTYNVERLDTEVINKIYKELSTKLDIVNFEELLIDLENIIKQIYIIDAKKVDVNSMADLVVTTDTLNKSITSNTNAIGAIYSNLSNKLNAPRISPSTNGQILIGNVSGDVEWTDPFTIDEEQIGDAVADWLDEHPEATTTVNDGSITMDKLSEEVQNTINNAGNAADIEILTGALETEIQAFKKRPISYKAFEKQLQTFANYSLTASPGIGFIYFSDPHNVDATAYQLTEQEIYNSFDTIRAIYERTATEYVLCGGDWLNSYYTKQEAAYLVGKIRNLMKTRICPQSYTVIGNHDYNEDYPKDSPFSYEQAARLWFGKNVGYYIIENDIADCYMFDSSSAHTDITVDYNAQQIDWFANKLLANQKQHLFGVIHIVRNSGTYDGSTTGIAPLANALTQLINAYNTGASSITINNKTYDFHTNTNKKFHCLLTGHTHHDANEIINNVPIIYTQRLNSQNTHYVAELNMYLNSMPLINVDLCYMDFNVNKLHMVRIGDGNSREIDI